MAFNSRKRESESMLQYSPTTSAKVNKARNVSEDIRNNNNDGNLDDVENVISDYVSNRKGIVAQLMVTGSVLLLAAGGGMPIGYSAVLLPQLTRENGTLQIDRELGSWIASIHSLATPVGSILSGPFLDAIGRRGCLQVACIPLCLGWFIMGFAKNISSILVGRVTSGFSVGLMAVPMQVLVTEMADPKLRGFLASAALVAYSFGILLIYALGMFFKWYSVAFCSTVLPLCAFVALSLVPESPAWLVSRKKSKKARKALLWLRGGDVDQVNTEIAILEARARVNASQQSVKLSCGQRVSSLISMIISPDVLKPLIIINIFNVLQTISGTYAVVFYAVDLIEDMGGETLDKYLTAVITAALRCCFCIVASVLMLKMGRRPLGILSALGTAAASLTLAVYSAIGSKGTTMDMYILAGGLFAYFGASTIGLLTLPGLMTGELLPQKARGIGGGLNFFILNFSLFLMTKNFPMICKSIGVAGILGVFATAAFLVAAFLYVVLPETKNRTLQEIEDYFQQPNLLWITRNRHRRPESIITSSA